LGLQVEQCWDLHVHLAHLREEWRTGDEDRCHDTTNKNLSQSAASCSASTLGHRSNAFHFLFCTQKPSGGDASYAMLPVTLQSRLTITAELRQIMSDSPKRIS